VEGSDAFTADVEEAKSGWAMVVIEIRPPSVQCPNCERFTNSLSDNFGDVVHSGKRRWIPAVGNEIASLKLSPDLKFIPCELRQFLNHSISAYSVVSVNKALKLFSQVSDGISVDAARWVIH